MLLHKITPQFRTITLLPKLGKISKRIITEHTLIAISKDNLHHPNPFGFYKQKSTVQVTGVQIIRNCVENHEIIAETHEGTSY